MLNKRQNKFCLEYLKDLNATKAAERAGYSKKTAKQIGAENLTKLDIKKKIEQNIKKQEKESEVKIDEIIKGIKKIAFAGLEKTSDKLKALEMLGKYLGMFKDKESNQNIIVNHITNLKEEIKL